MRYISDSIISFSIKVQGREGNARVSFSPRTSGGSTFSTDSESLIKALESNEMFGRVYRRAPECLVEQSPRKKASKTSEKQQLTAIDGGEGWQDAIDHLVDNYGVKASSLTSPDVILKEAAKYNIWFPNLK